MNERPLAYPGTAASTSARLRNAAPCGALPATVKGRFMIRNVPGDDLAKLTSGHVLMRGLPWLRRKEPELDPRVPGSHLASIARSRDLGRRPGRASGDSNPVHTTRGCSVCSGVFCSGLACATAGARTRTGRVSNHEAPGAVHPDCISRSDAQARDTAKRFRGGGRARPHGVVRIDHRRDVKRNAPGISTCASRSSRRGYSARSTKPWRLLTERLETQNASRVPGGILASLRRKTDYQR